MHLRLRQQDDRKRTDGKTALIGKQPHEEDRHYLQGVIYVLPKDLPEQSRLDFQHYLLYAVLGTHAAAPVGEQVRHILDVATGTGRWAHEMARSFPQCSGDWSGYGGASQLHREARQLYLSPGQSLCWASLCRSYF